MGEWLKPPVLKTGSRKARGFESRSLRHDRRRGPVDAPGRCARIPGAGLGRPTSGEVPEWLNGTVC